MSDKLERAEMEELNRLPGFRKFLWRSIQSAGLFTAANGAAGRNLDHIEGRRFLGFEILRDAARGMPVDDPEAALKLLLTQILREDLQPTSEERQSGRRNRYDTDERDGDAADGS